MNTRHSPLTAPDVISKLVRLGFHDEASFVSDLAQIARINTALADALTDRIGILQDQALDAQAENDRLKRYIDEEFAVLRAERDFYKNQYTPEGVDMDEIDKVYEQDNTPWYVAEWPDGTWCNWDDRNQYTHMSDDYQKRRVLRYAPDYTPTLTCCVTAKETTMHSKG
jgi:hypothetical protein